MVGMAALLSVAGTQRVEVPLGAQTVAAAIGCFVNVKSVLFPGAQAWDSAAQHASI